VNDQTQQADDSRPASERLLAVVDRAKTGDPSAIVEVRRFMDDAPALANVYNWNPPIACFSRRSRCWRQCAGWLFR
jgi:hypothetical protein